MSGIGEEIALIAACRLLAVRGYEGWEWKVGAELRSHEQPEELQAVDKWAGSERPGSQSSLSITGCA